MEGLLGDALGTLEDALEGLEVGGTVDELLKGRLEAVRATLQEVLSQAGEQVEGGANSPGTARGHHRGGAVFGSIAGGAGGGGVRRGSYATRARGVPSECVEGDSVLKSEPERSTKRASPLAWPPVPYGRPRHHDGYQDT